VSGPHSTHLPPSVVCGSSAGLRGTVNSRTFGFLEFFLCSAASAQPLSDISMFDWPLHTHTSPT
jgi:hypothetical protein